MRTRSSTWAGNKKNGMFFKRKESDDFVCFNRKAENRYYGSFQGNVHALYFCFLHFYNTLCGVGCGAYINHILTFRFMKATHVVFTDMF